jgi:hypothetical protein
MRTIQAYSKNQLIAPILGGYFTALMMSVSVGEILRNQFAINIKFAFSSTGTALEAIVFIVAMFFSAALGAIAAGYMAKRQYMLVGVLSSLLNFLVFFIFVSLVVFIMFALGVNLRGVDLSFLKSDTMFNIYMRWLFSVITILAGGITGGSVGKRLHLQWLPLLNHGRIIGNAHFDDYLKYYFSCRWRSFFTISIFVNCISLFIFFIPNFINSVKWLTIGSLFILVHPPLWFTDIWADSAFSLLLVLPILLPIVYMHWVYKIGTSKINKALKCLLILLVYVFVNFGAYLLSDLGKMPIYDAMDKVSRRGGWAWGILLDKFTRPMVHENRYLYFLEKKDIDKAKAELLSATELYYKLGENQLRSQGIYNQANNAFNKVVELSGNDFDWEMKVVDAYYGYEHYDQAREMLEGLHDRYVDNLDIMLYLVDVYSKGGENEKALPLLERAYQIRKHELTHVENERMLERIEDIRRSVAIIGIDEK